MPEDTKKLDTFALPEARLINHSLFIKDQYNEQAVPSYKIEVVVGKDSEDHISIENKLLDLVVDKWGEGADEDEDLVLPLLDGDKHAAKREKKGKEGTAYKGMTIIRASTIYNKHGDDDAGGIQVFGPDVEPITAANKSEIYQGCYGILAVNFGFYQTSEGDNGVKLYLQAFQKTRDGERLFTASDRSTLFKPVGREGGSTRRSRRAHREA